MNDPVANIIEGGCYHLHRTDRDPKIDRKHVILAVVIEIVAIVVAAYRLLGK